MAETLTVSSLAAQVAGAPAGQLKSAAVHATKKIRERPAKAKVETGVTKEAPGVPAKGIKQESSF